MTQIYHHYSTSNKSLSLVVHKSTQTDTAFDYEFLENLGNFYIHSLLAVLLINFYFLPVLTNSQLVLNILSVNSATNPINFPTADVKSLSCLSTLTTIPEAISAEPSCSNLHNLSRENIVEAEKQSWRIYENDRDNSKSTDALLKDIEHPDQAIFPQSINVSVIKENQYESNSNSSSRLFLFEVTEKPNIARSRSNSKNGSKIYDPISSESLNDSRGYMDDFDESCALITNENNGNRKRILSSSDLIMKRNNLGVNKAPQSHRFSAGDADKLEKGIKALPSTRSLRDS